MRGSAMIRALGHKEDPVAASDLKRFAIFGKGWWFVAGMIEQVCDGQRRFVFTMNDEGPTDATDFGQTFEPPFEIFGVGMSGQSLK